MTDEQMRERMKEIDKERSKLKTERKEYEKYFYNKKLNEVATDHKQYVGKCFITLNLPNNNQKSIKAFKIINVLDAPRGDYAECVTLVDGFEKNCWNVNGVKIETLGLWTPNTLRMMSRDSDPKVIDFYKEITQEEFENLYSEWNMKIQDEVYK